MNSVLDLDPIAKRMVDKSIEPIINSYHNVVKFLACYEGELFALAKALIPFDPINFTSHGSDYIYISFVGDKTKFKRLFGVFLARGFGDYSQPKEKSDSYSTYLTHASGMKVYLAYQSTTCRKVQVGYETKQIPIFEIQCGDNDFTPDPQLEDQTEKGVLLTQDDDIPF